MTPARPMLLPQAPPKPADQGPRRRLAEDLEAVCRQVGGQARELMAVGGSYCAPAVLMALNQRLGGGLSEDLIRRLTAGLPEGMGSGCTCGALTGGQMALGLFLGERGYGGAMTKAARALHDGFKAQEGSTCCRVLTKKSKGRRDRREHCSAMAGLAAELACRQVLASRPELAAGGESAPLPGARPWWRRMRRG